MFHIHNESWVLLSPKAKEQYAVVGHSAHIVTLKNGRVVMLVIFGHCPLYGYISSVQEYDLGRYIFFSEYFLNVKFKVVCICYCQFGREPKMFGHLDLYKVLGGLPLKMIKVMCIKFPEISSVLS